MFIGYSLSYWNFRGIVHSLRHSPANNPNKWWVIQEKPETFDDQLWEQYGDFKYKECQQQFKLWTKEQIFSLEHYVDTLDKELELKIQTQISKVLKV